jgi:Ser/Thr protein kinase RdoA (MazF antagonist)
VSATWSKRYRSLAAAQRAAAHHRWLAAAGGVRLPALVAVAAEGPSLVLERVAGAAPASAAELQIVAHAIGRWHATLADGVLAGRRATEPLAFANGTIPAFLDARRVAALAAALAPGALVSDGDLARVAALAAAAEPSIYKDANVRNVLIDAGKVVHVDFDDLTLAPAGYDLAKLAVSWAMTHGRRPALAALLAAYNAGAGRELCTPDPFALWIELHHMLSWRHRARAGYAHAWPRLRTRGDAAAVRRALSARAAARCPR